jgi:hypothetical protein
LARLARLNALRKDIIERNIAKHKGRIVKLMGDGASGRFRQRRGPGPTAREGRVVGVAGPLVAIERSPGCLV